MAVWVNLAASAVPADLEASVESVVWAVSVVPADLEVSAAIVPRHYLQEEMGSATGHTTPYIAAALLIPTGRRQIDLGGVRGVIRSPGDRLAHDNKLHGRVEI